jgi:spore germination cell wall hydrolase CwlJ-like protein
VTDHTVTCTLASLVKASSRPTVRGEPERPRQRLSEQCSRSAAATTLTPTAADSGATALAGGAATDSQTASPQLSSAPDDRLKPDTSAPHFPVGSESAAGQVLIGPISEQVATQVHL